MTAPNWRVAAGNRTARSVSSRVKCPMPSGVVVTLPGEGEGLSLEDVIEALVELLKAAKKANGEGLTLRPFRLF